jgi:hypothetical protein
MAAFGCSLRVDLFLGDLWLTPLEFETKRVDECRRQKQEADDYPAPRKIPRVRSRHGLLPCGVLPDLDGSENNGDQAQDILL